MKRRFVECAILLGIVMSVMLFAQTQDGLGHSACMHLPVFYVDSAGCNIGDGSGDDPRGLDFQTMGGYEFQTMGGYEYSHSHISTGHGWYYQGGLLNLADQEATNNPSSINHPGDTTKQKIYKMDVITVCLTNVSTASASITPSLSYADALPQKDDNIQGTGTIELSFSGVCYHEIRSNGKNRRWCVENTRGSTLWGPKTEVIWVKIRILEHASKREGSFGGGLGGAYGSISSGYSHSDQVTEKNIHARSFGINAKLRGQHFDNVIEKQDKFSYAYGSLESANSGDVCSTYLGIDDHQCPGSGSQ